MKNLVYISLLLLAFACSEQKNESVGMSTDWTADTLVNSDTVSGYEMRRVAQPNDYDGAVVSSVVRRLIPDSDKGVLYVHGYNDYFLQAEMGVEFNDHGYQFYALDLRKYGRSILPGQRQFQMRSVGEYFADIDSALSIMADAGVKDVVIMGHSTGGLIVSCYMSAQDHEHSAYSRLVKAVVLNSPFLDWNQGSMEKFIPAISAVGAVLPGLEISQSGSAYSESLLKGEHGEWNFNTAWKVPVSPDVDLGWIRGITEGQRSLRDGKAGITQPILLMYSSRSIEGGEWTPDHNDGDAVLDVADIRRYGLGLGPDVTPVKVQGGLHDLLLSRPAVRSAVYAKIFSWLAKEGV